MNNHLYSESVALLFKHYAIGDAEAISDASLAITTRPDQLNAALETAALAYTVLISAEGLEVLARRGHAAPQSANLSGIVDLLRQAADKFEALDTRSTGQ